jgi:hypothetical protein
MGCSNVEPVFCKKDIKEVLKDYPAKEGWEALYYFSKTGEVRKINRRTLAVGANTSVSLKVAKDIEGYAKKLRLVQGVLEEIRFTLAYKVETEEYTLLDSSTNF